MKKNLKRILCVGIFVAILFGIFAITETHQAKGTIVKVNSFETLIETEDGNLWSIQDMNFCVGDKVTITFNDMQTEEIEDDTIISIKKY